MRLIVTGGLGCGKSSVVRLLREFLPSYPVFSFDEAVADAYKRPHIIAKLNKHFGVTIKANISEIVFADKSGEKKRLIESIITPEVVHQLKHFCSLGDRWIAEIPLWFEGYELWSDITERTILCVTAPQTIQVDRVIQRNGFSTEKIESIIASQMPIEYKIANSDYVIANDGDILKLRSEVLRLINRY